MADLIRVGVVLDTTGLKSGVTQAKAQFDRITQGAAEAQFQADLLRDRFHKLQQQYQLGQIGSAQYSAGLRTLRADIAALTAQTNLGVESQSLLARTSQQAGAAIHRIGMASQMGGKHAFFAAKGFSQSAFALQGFALAAGSGASRMQSLSMGLLSLGMGSPVMMGAIAGFAAVAAAITLIGSEAEDTEEKLGSMTDRLSAARGLGSGIQPRQQALIRELRGTTRTVTEGSQQTGFETRTVTDLPSEARRREIMRELAVLRTARRQLESGNFLGPGGIETPATTRGEPGKPRQRADDKFLTGAFAPTTLELVDKDLDKIATTADRATDAALNLGKAFEDIKTQSMALTDGVAAGFGEMIDAFAGGGNAGKAFFGGLLRELSRYAKVQAVVQLAEGFAALFKNPAAAVAHFRSAALFGAGAALAGSAGGGTGGGGTGGGFGRGPIDRARDPDAQRVVVVQIVGQRTGEVIQQTVTGINRQQALGGLSLRGDTIRVPVEGVLVSRA